MEEDYNHIQNEFWYNFIWEVGGDICELCEIAGIENNEKLRNTFEEQVAYGFILLNIIFDQK